jgi:hypothetical protein
MPGVLTTIAPGFRVTLTLAANVAAGGASQHPKINKEMDIRRTLQFISAFVKTKKPAV